MNLIKICMHFISFIFHFRWRAYPAAASMDLPCKGDALRLLYSFGDMRAFRWNMFHCPWIGTTNKTNKKTITNNQ